MPAAAAAVMIGGAIAKNVSQSRAANSARDAQLNAANQANQGITDWRSNLQGMYNPYMQQGQQASGMLSQMANNPIYNQAWGGQSPFGNSQIPQGSMGASGQAMTGGFTGATGAQPDPTAMRRGGLGTTEGPVGPTGLGINRDADSMGDPRALSVSTANPDMQGGPTTQMPQGAYSVQPGWDEGPVTDPAKYGIQAPPGSGGWVPSGMGAIQNALAQNSINEAQMGNRRGGGQGNAMDYMNDPGMAYATRQANEAMNQRLASMGLSQSGAAVKQSGELAADLGNRFFGEAYGRFANDRAFNASREDARFGQGISSADLGLRSQAQNFGQGMANKQFGLQNRQVDWSQLMGQRGFEQGLRQEQMGLLSGLSNQGFNALNQYGQFGTGMQGQIMQNQLGMGNAQAASQMANPWIGIGGTASNLGAAYFGAKG